MVQAGGPARKRLARYGTDPSEFYESVKAHMEEEIDKANVELRKRGLSPIERVFIPGFLGRLCLTFGTALLLSVELEYTKGRIRAVLFGPPNRSEISRKEYSVNAPAPRSQAQSSNEFENVAYGPDKIAADIVAGLLMGKLA